MAATKISWCDEVWNPLTGCERVSAGCDNCYAFSLHDKWYAANKDAARIRGLEERDTPAPPFPVQYDKPFSQVQLLPDRLDQPLHWRRPRRVFVNSMGDLFHEDVDDQFISLVFAVMSMAPQHKFLILTKRPERMRDYLMEMAGDPDAYVWAWAHEAAGVFLDGAEHPPAVETWPLPNVWLGVSVENQETADERIPKLLQTPGALKWASCEPLLGPVDLEHGNYPFPDGTMTSRGDSSYLKDTDCCFERREFGECRCAFQRPGLDWVVVGGESGPHFRPMDHAWAQQIRDQCREAGVAFFGKQDSGRRPGIELPGELAEREWPR